MPYDQRDNRQTAAPVRLGALGLRYAILLAAACALAAVVAACTEDSGDTCLESNATKYRFSAPGDTSLVFRWPSSYMPVRVYAEPAPNLAANTLAGLQLWVDAFRCGEISYTITTDSTQADVIVRNPAVMPPEPGGALIFGADSVGACHGRTDILLLDTADVLDGPIRSYVTPNSGDPTAVAACYRFTVAHELGHTSGLFSHSGNPEDLMHSIPRRRVTSINDRFTIQKLYRANPTILPPPR